MINILPENEILLPYNFIREKQELKIKGVVKCIIFLENNNKKKIPKFREYKFENYLFTVSYVGNNKKI